MRTFLRLAVLGLLVLVAVPAGTAAQSSDAGSTALPPILPRAREVALARSAAPAQISADATVMVLVRGRGYEVAEAGTNGVTCLVSRSWPEAIEPHCFDPEGARTILRIHLREAELKELAWSREAIQADIGEGLRTGRLSPPSRAAVTWMMSAAQILYNDDGERVGAWKPHLMIYQPYMTASDLGLTGAPPADGPMLVDEGRPTSNLVIVMPSFVEPAPGGGG